MECTHRYITYWNNRNFIARSYSTLASNNEETFIKWLHQQGVVFNHINGIECHDMGETDYFAGSIDTGDINAIMSFIGKLYGEWRLNVTYKEVKIEIWKQYPNIVHHLRFTYPKDSEDILRNVFMEMEKMFCYPEIKEWIKYI